eukprot:gb/GEZN01008574.1/.p1 GENE.gb/GEZN01008574.1/~~gb/GEZN01008574.1/.p1  ORF type:complete len:304 (-),score=30.92 gb/GEZN01008574.1/:411-1322(-)
MPDPAGEHQPLRAVNQNDISDRVMHDDNGAEGIAETIFRYSAIFICTLLLFIPIFWFSCIKVFDQHERIVHFRLGKVQGKSKGPGIFIFLPFLDEYRKVDLRMRTIDVPPQEMMTKDSVTVSVNAVVFYHVRDPVKSILCAENFQYATSLLGQTTLRAIIGESELDELLTQREKINEKMTSVLDEGTDPWGVRVTSVEIKDVQVPQNMQRAMGSQAEAERERRAKVISAEGELQASQALLQAANNMSRNTSTMQLRYMSTLNQIAQEKNSTIVFPLPISLLTMADAAADTAVSRAKAAKKLAA